MIVGVTSLGEISNVYTADFSGLLGVSVGAIASAGMQYVFSMAYGNNAGGLGGASVGGQVATLTTYLDANGRYTTRMAEACPVQANALRHPSVAPGRQAYGTREKNQRPCGLEPTSPSTQPSRLSFIAFCYWKRPFSFVLHKGWIRITLSNFATFRNAE